MPKKDLFSVIIPTYYRNDKLELAIKSVLSQTYKKLEIIVCDDGNKLETKQLCNSFGDSRIKYFKNENSHGGPARPRNIGIQNSYGEFIAFLDDDDQWVKNKLEIQYKFFKKTKVDFLSSNAFKIIDNKKKNKPLLSYLKYKVDVESLIKNNSIICSSVVIKLSNKLNKKKLYFRESRYFNGFEDYELWLRLTKQNFVIYSINKPLLYYNVSQNSLGTKNNYLKIAIIQMYYGKKISNFFKFIKLLFLPLKKLYQNKKNLKLNKEKDLISILMPVKNEEKYIETALDSILNQSYQKFELIIINDCSKDNSSNLINQYYDERIKVFNFQKSVGISKCLNKAISLAKGKYIARMDADDIAYPNRLKYQLKFMQQNPKIDLLSGNINYIKSTGKSYILKNLIVFFSNKKINNSLLKIIILHENVVKHPTVFAKKKLLTKIRYNSDYDSVEDWQLWIRLLNKNFCFYIDDSKVLNYRIHNKQNSIKSKTKLYKLKNYILKISDPNNKKLLQYLSNQNKNLELKKLTDFVSNMNFNFKEKKFIFSKIFYNLNYSSNNNNIFVKIINKIFNELKLFYYLYKFNLK